MTVAELIENLKRFPPDMLVTKRRSEGGGHFRWDGMDGHWFQTVLVEKVENPLCGDYYREAREDGIEALEL